MQKYQKVGSAGLLTAYVLAFGMGIYSRVWEKAQLKQEINQARVVSIEPYSSRNDLHWNVNGVRVYIEGEDRPIDFPSDRWNDSVQQGDSVDLVIRRSFSWFGLFDEFDGLDVRID